MHLDARDTRSFERVEDRERRVRVRARVQEEAIVFSTRAGDEIANLPFVVRLARVEACAELFGQRLEPRVDLRERLGSLDLGLARPQELEVGARDAEDFDQSSARSLGAAVRIR